MEDIYKIDYDNIEIIREYLLIACLKQLLKETVNVFLIVSPIIFGIQNKIVKNLEKCIKSNKEELLQFFPAENNEVDEDKKKDLKNLLRIQLKKVIYLEILKYLQPQHYLMLILFYLKEKLIVISY